MNNKTEITKDIKKNQPAIGVSTETTTDSTPPGASRPAAEIRNGTAAIFEPFSWLPRSMRGSVQAEFVARTRDVCRGIQACLEIVQSDGLDRDASQETLLSMSQTEHLFMLAIQAAAMLAEESDREIDCMHDRAAAEVQP